MIAQGCRSRLARRAAEPLPDAVPDLDRRRRKLLELCYADKINADLFAQEERRLIQAQTINVEKLERHQAAQRAAEQVAARFEQVAEILSLLEAEEAWAAANWDERRVLVEELLDELSLYPDHEIARTGTGGRGRG